MILGGADGATRRAGRTPRGLKGTGYTKPEVVELATTILKELGKVTPENLKSQVLKTARESGKSVKGLARVLQHALKDARFQVADSGIQLAK